MDTSNLLKTIIPLVLLLVVMYFLLIRPQKKREKETNAMRNNVDVGDNIVTIGGIYGKVVKTKDETLVIQVGADKVKFEIARWAVSKVLEKGARSMQKETVAEAEEEAPKKKLPKRMGAKKEETPAEEAPAEEAPAEEPAVEEAPAEDAE